MSKNSRKAKTVEFADWVKSVNRISEKILMNDDPDVTTETILETLQDHLQCFGAIYLAVNHEKKELYLRSYTQSYLVKKAMKLVLFDVHKIVYPLNHPDILIAQCVREKRIVQSKNLRDFFYPVFQSASTLDRIQRILGFKTCAAVPVSIGNQTVGAFFIISKKESLTDDQLQLLQFYANLSGIAIDTSRKYRELESKYEQEKTTTSMLSHELKTPIAIAHNSSQLLKRYVQGRKDQLGDMVTEFNELHEEIDGSVKRLNYICGSIFNLIDSEDRDTDVLHKLDLEKQLEQVFDIYRRKTEEKGLDFSYDLQVASGTFYGGGVQFEQVITILLDNAVKYTRKGGINLKVLMDEDKMCCKVTDTGPGIPKNKREAIFGRFYRHKSLANRNLKDIEGLGLGLYVAKRLTQKLGGSIEAYDNSIERGTQFVVEMPVYSEMPQTG